MSIEGFVSSLKKQLKELHTKQAGASGSERGSYTRKIEINEAIKKATRKGVQ